MRSVWMVIHHRCIPDEDAHHHHAAHFSTTTTPPPYTHTHTHTVTRHVRERIRFLTSSLRRRTTSLGARVLGDGLGAFADCVLGQLAGQQEPHGCLHLPGRDRGPLVVVGESRRLGGDALEDVVHERVHDGHRLTGDAGVRVDLFEHFVDVDGVALLPLVLLLLLVRLGDVLLGLTGFLGGLSASLGRHDN